MQNSKFPPNLTSRLQLLFEHALRSDFGRAGKIFFFLFYFIFSFSRPAKAAFSFEIESINPITVPSKATEVEVFLSITELPSESYFRVAWQEGEGKSYFGYMKNNGGSWVKIKALSEDCTGYFHVTDTEITSLTLVAKIGEDEEVGAGKYLIKAHRFTAGCSPTSSENAMEIDAVLPPPASTPTPTQEPEAPTKTPTPKPTKKPTSALTPEKKVLGEESDVEKTTFRLSELDGEEGEEATEEGEEKKGLGQLLPFIMIGGGLALIIAATFPFLYPRLKMKFPKNPFSKESS